MEDLRPGLNSALLWLGCRPTAVALIQPRAWEHPYAVGVALKANIYIYIANIYIYIYIYTHTHTHIECADNHKNERINEVLK